MTKQPYTPNFERLAAELDGELHTDPLYRMLYATDASVYRQRPLAVAVPKTTADLQRLIRFAHEEQIGLIPRAGGTSLAGQVVGKGIVVDISKYFNRILEINPDEGWVRVQPGVIRDELNAALRPHGLFFGPNTSTANRCMLGGMVGNNSCGTTSIRYGTTRDHVLSMQVLLSDGSEVTFSSLSAEAFHQKRQQDNLEGRLYEHIYASLSDPHRQERIRAEFPKRSIHRRNTGYAIDELIEQQPFHPEGTPFNFCTLLTGSEGTLAFTTELKLHVDPLPPEEVAVLCAHFESIDESMEAVGIAMAHRPYACELMDKIILDLTKENIEQQKNRFFVQDDPEAILMIELRADTPDELEQQVTQLEQDFRDAGRGYAFPIVYGPQTKQVWALRSAGLGILANIPGDPKAVACIEDTAVDIVDLPDYIADFAKIMAEYDQEAVYYAHAGAGEIHLRPILDLKSAKDQQLFHDITLRTAQLVKRYRGSLSGEHGDGRVRAAFIPLMIGEDNYAFLRELKQAWDPTGIFNPGKIVDAAPMNEDLRYEAGQTTPEFETMFDYSAEGGIVRMAEKCNGSGDCRKLNGGGGVMCPSYRATRDEKDSTRGRANILREVLTKTETDQPFNHPALDEALDLCLSCKGCTAECPSNVDVSSLKAEYLYQKYLHTGVPLRSRIFAEIGRLNRLAAQLPWLSNFVLKYVGFIKILLGVASERSLPLLHRESLRRWWKREGSRLQPESNDSRAVLFFCDEFTNFNDVEAGIAAIRLLNGLGYRVHLPRHADSGRAHISKGLLKIARRMAAENVSVFAPKVTSSTPLVGLEPSAILGFRDEYPRLLRGAEQARAKKLAEQVYTLEEFLEREANAGRIGPESFTEAPRRILLHGHCHQKALGSVSSSAFCLGLPSHYSVEVIPSGCCGMAGSFGYEKEHYDLSMKIGEQVLFPAVRSAADDLLLAAPGTSCRHQIEDGTQRTALHPAQILYEALKRSSRS